jgi:PKD repeat protein
MIGMVFTRVAPIVAFLVLKLNGTSAQCPSVDFTIPSQACINEAINIQFTADATLKYEWDFCSGDLINNLSLVRNETDPLVKSPFHMEVVNDNGIYRGFVANSAAKNLLRLDYINGLAKAPTVQVINTGSFFQDARCVRLIMDRGIWYGLMTDLASAKVFRLKFADGLLSSPLIQELPSVSLTLPLDIALEKNGNDFVAVILNFSFSDASITRLKFVDNMEAVPLVKRDNITGISATSISLKKNCNNWLGFVALSGSGSNFGRIDFGISLFDSPISSMLINLSNPGIVNPIRGISIAEEGSDFFGFINSSDGRLFRLEFGNDIASVSPSITDLGFMFSGTTTNAWDNEMVKDGSDWYLFIMDYISNSVQQEIFFSNCNANINSVTTSDVPYIFFKDDGLQKVQLKATDIDGNFKVVSKTLTVSSTVAPPLSFSKSNIQCPNLPLEFTITSDLSTITDIHWDMGDGSIRTTNPTSYGFSSAGSYPVKLTTAFSNGCGTFVTQLTQIYNPPLANFDLPTISPICTNQQLLFTNTSTIDPQSSPTWKWLVNDIETSSSLNLQYAFKNETNAAITLIASLPGCQNQIVKAINLIIQGPIVDFSFMGKCDKDQIHFTNDTQEVNASYDWDFNDGTTSTMVNPDHVFPTAGTYPVSLKVSSPSGCNNSKTKAVPIYTNPSTDFQINPPPFSCTGSATPFTDLTPDPSDSDITSWQWTFGDVGNGNTSAFQNPAHTYATAGDYTVSLTATSNFGCSNTKQKAITIATSPIAAINNTAACNNLPINFTTPTAGIRSFYWEMGTVYYETANPTHTFTVPGNYIVKLTATGNNNCVTKVAKNVIIPVPLIPDFSVKKNCVGTDAVFTDITPGSDPVISRNWDFAGLGTATGSPVSFQFASLGSKSIKLTVIAQSGCMYTKSKNVPIIASPVADFTAVPALGAAPLSTHFTNKSANSTLLQWSFQDGSSPSTETSPSHVFQNLGEYNVELKASNAEGCESKTSKLVQVVAPLPDVDLKLLTVAENPDGTLKVIITIKNNGNTFLQNLPIFIDLAGTIALRETVKETIAPAALYNLVLSYGIVKTDNVNFLCAIAELQDDLAPANNRICTDLESKTIILSAYPNPVNDELHIEWIADRDKIVNMLLIDSFGKKVFGAKVASTEGLNQSLFMVDQLQSGIYLLVFSDGIEQRTQKIFISGQN